MPPAQNYLTSPSERTLLTSEDSPAASLEPTDTPTLILLGCGALMILATFLLSPGLADLIEHLRSQIESEASNAGSIWEWIGAENLGKVLVTAPSLMVVLLALTGWRFSRSPRATPFSVGWTDRLWPLWRGNWIGVIHRIVDRMSHGKWNRSSRHFAFNTDTVG